MGLLIGGFGLGQGSIFLAQTYLVATGRTELLALFGTHFSVAMLGIIAVEAGSLTILSAQIARLLVAQGDEHELWRVYWETTVYRLSMAIGLIVGLLIFYALVPLPAFSASYLIGVLPALLIWAFTCGLPGRTAEKRHQRHYRFDRLYRLCRGTGAFPQG